MRPWQRTRLLRALAPKADPCDRLYLFPERVMSPPGWKTQAEAWQSDLIRQLICSGDNVLALCSRGAGKTYSVAAAVYLEACLGGFALVVSRSDEQAMKIIEYAQAYRGAWNLRPLVRDSMHDMQFKGGGRLKARPCREDTIRGEHNVTLLVLDEAARIPDLVWGASTAMTDGVGRMALLSTPFGRRGFFHKEWEGKGREGWKRHRYSWHDCPRLTPEFIAKERASHGEQWVRQEYLDCPPGEEFLGVESGVFDSRDYAQLVSTDIEPLVW